MRCVRWFLLSTVAGALACSAEDSPPEPGRAAVAQCSSGEVSAQCPRNGQTGSLGRSDDHGVGFEYGVGLGCPAEVIELEPHADTGLGFDAQALVDLVSGTHRESLLWLEGSPVATGAGTAAGSISPITQLSVEIEVIGAAQLLVRDEQGVVPPGAPPGAVPGAHCPTAVGLPVRVKMQSEDGALDGTVETTLEAGYGDFARLAFLLPAAELSGSPSSGPELAVELGVTPLGIMGSLSAYSLPASSDGSGEPTTAPLAQFPAQRYCTPLPRGSTPYNYTSQVYLAADQEFRGISLEGQLARLNRASPVSAHPLGDPSRRPLSLAFASTDDHLCLELESHGCSSGLAIVPATVRMSTSDGEIDGELATSLRLVGTSEQPEISAGVYLSAATLDESLALVQASGIHAPIDYTGQVNAAVLFGALLDDQGFQGSLTVLGYRSVPCNVERPDGAQCLFNSAIWLLDWGAPPYSYQENFCGASRPARG